MKKYPPSEILPHKEPMILVDDYSFYDENTIKATVTIKPNSPFCENGKVPSYVCLEYMAQAIAMWRGLLDKESDKGPKVGYLVSCRKFFLNKDCFTVGETLHIHGNLKCMIDQMASFDCTIIINQEQVAQSSLNVFQVGD